MSDNTTPAQQAVYAVLAKASCTEPHVYDGEARIIPWLVRVDGMVDMDGRFESLTDE
jgi:hypothetical protein